MVVTSGGCLVYLDPSMSTRQTRQVTTFMQAATRILHIIVKTAKIYGLWAKWFTSVRWLIRLKRFECYIKLKLCYFTDLIYPSAFKLVESCRRHANCKAYPIVCWVPKLCPSYVLQHFTKYHHPRQWRIYFEPESTPPCVHIDHRAMSTTSCWLCFK